MIHVPNAVRELRAMENELREKWSEPAACRPPALPDGASTEEVNRAEPNGSKDKP